MGRCLASGCLAVVATGAIGGTGKGAVIHLGTPRRR
jgi:hypothetical protein